MLKYLVGFLSSDEERGSKNFKYVQKTKLFTYVLVIPVCLTMCVSNVQLLQYFHSEN